MPKAKRLGLGRMTRMRPPKGDARKTFARLYIASEMVRIHLPQTPVTRLQL